MINNDKKINFRLSKALLELLDNTAKRTGVDRSKIIREALGVKLKK